MDAGLSVRQGNDQDQTLATLRPGYEFNVGQIAVKIGYSFEYGKYQGATETLRQSLFINMQRNF